MTRFGDFQDICTKTPFPFCSVVQSYSIKDEYFPTGIMPTCFARSVELSNTMIYQVGNAVMNIGGLVVCLIILFNIKTKYTAILRSEMCVFFYQFTGLLVATLIVDSGVAPPGKAVFDYFVAVQIGLAGSCCWSLVFIAFLCFQLWEDGTKRSLLSLNVSAFLIWATNFLVAIFTFKNWSGGVSKDHTIGLFVMMYIVNAIFIGIYVFSQLVLSGFVLNNYWAMGAILLGSFFFIVSQIVAHVFSKVICENLNHYLDGLFFSSMCNLFAIMMIYKYWDIITSEDLEFSVAAQETGVAFNSGAGNRYHDNRSSRFFPKGDTKEKSLMG